MALFAFSNRTLGLVCGLLALPLVGCGTSATIPPSQVADVSERLKKDPYDTVEVLDTESGHTRGLSGGLSSIVIYSKNDEGIVDPKRANREIDVGGPVWVSNEGEEMVVTSWGRARSAAGEVPVPGGYREARYPIDRVREVKVTSYGNFTGRRIGGIVLLSLSVPCFAGTFAITGFSGSGGRDDSGGAGTFIPVFAAPFFLTGVIGTIAGTVLLLTSPPTAPAKKSILDPLVTF